MNRTKIIDKVRKIFSLAENNPSEEETAVALRTAHDLMIKYEIQEMELEEVSGQRQTAEGFICFFDKIKLPQWMYRLANSISRYYGCACVFQKFNSIHQAAHTEVVFYGLPTASQTAAIAYFSVYKQIKKMSSTYQPTRSSDNEIYQNIYRGDCIRSRSSYREGLTNGLIIRINDYIQKMEEERNSQITALAVRSSDLEVEYQKDKFPSMVTKRVKQRPVDRVAYRAGIQDSQQIDLNNKLIV